MNMADSVNQIPKEVNKLVRNHLSLEMATVSESGAPSVSYAPFVSGENLTFYVFLSDLAQHTHNIAKNHDVSVMIIEDEKTSQNLFARERLIIECTATRHERKSPEFQTWIPLYKERFGAIVDTLVQLADFNLYSLVPKLGVYIKGFGQAYRISGPNMSEIEHITNPALNARKTKQQP